MMQKLKCDTTIIARPYTLILRTTERCEVGCDHCCINATPQGADMDLEFAKEILEGAKQAQVGLIHISGGEPLLHSQLEQFVEASAKQNFYVEITTSTYSKKGEHPSSRIALMKDAGLKRLMLSYDASHARRVPIEQFAEFICEAQFQNLEICVMVVDWQGSLWPMERVMSECEALGVKTELVDWCRSSLSTVGRAESHYKEKSTSSGKDSRCPYILTAPTLAPDGTVFLCPNLQSRSKLYQLGNAKEQPIQSILENLENSRFYRALSAMGPHKTAEIIGLPEEYIPEDMCQCCQLVLKEAETPQSYTKIESIWPEDTLVPLDIEALLPGHQRFISGEERPSVGCVCG